MSYCNDNEKATVTYKFADSSEQKLETTGAITVQTGVINPNGTNYNPNGYLLTFYSTNNRRNVSVVATNYQVTDTGEGGIFKWVIRWWDCNNDSASVNVDPSTITIDSSINCPAQPTEQQCFIQINKNGSRIFWATGKCPVKFNVACGDECPPNHIKCNCPQYPGYCCIPCSELVGGIRAATAQVRSINYG